MRELQQSANEAFSQFGEAHRQMEKCGIVLLTRLKPVCIAWCWDLNVGRERESGGIRDENTDVRKLNDR